MNEYPQGWREVRLGDAAQWFSGGTPSTAYPQYWGGDIPWISAASLKDFEIYDSDRRVTKLGAISGTRLVEAGATLFVVRGMSLKTEFRVGIARRTVAFGQDCKALIPSAGLRPRFLAYAIKALSSRILMLVDEAGHGTGRLATQQVADLKLGIPPVAEQHRITEILDAVDESIRSTERLIAKLGQTRQGMLYELLTHGIDESGNIRDLQQPGEAADSPLGRIPLTWSVTSLARVSHFRES